MSYFKKWVEFDERRVPKLKLYSYWMNIFFWNSSIRTWGCFILGQNSFNSIANVTTNYFSIFELANNFSCLIFSIYLLIFRASSLDCFFFCKSFCPMAFLKAFYFAWASFCTLSSSLNLIIFFFRGSFMGILASSLSSWHSSDVITGVRLMSFLNECVLLKKRWMFLYFI